MTRLCKVLLLTMLVFALQLTLGSADLRAVNQVRLETPVTMLTAVAGDSIGIKVHITNDADLGGFTLGFHYNSDLVEVTSVQKGPVSSAGGSFLKTFVPASNKILVGYADFSGDSPILAQDDGLAFTLWMKLLPGVTAHCVDIDSSYVPPAGPFIFAPVTGGKITPNFVDAGTVDVIIGGSTCPSANTPPVVADIPNQIIAEGGTFATINLDNYVVDAESADNLITWIATSASPNSFSVDINATTRVATISFPGGEFSGSALFTFTATDPGLLSASDTARFTVTPVNDAPVVAGIPDQILPYGATFATINLDSYVTDPDNTPAEMTWSYSGNVQLIVAISPTHVATITKPSPDWNGSESIIFTATDPGTLADSDTATFSIAAPPVNQAPVVAGIPDQILPYGATFATISLDSYVTDPDNADAQMTWSYSDNAPLTVEISPERIATITKPSPDWSGSVSIIFTATDPGLLSDSDTATFSIAAATPIIKITPDTLTFSAYAGGSNPADQGTMITNTGNGTFDWNASEATTWLTLSSTSGTAPSGFTVSIDKTGLAPGSYNADVTITAAGATNSPQVLKVILNVLNPVDIKLTPDSLNFYARKGDPNPASKDVGITNRIPSGVEFNWAAVETSPWLSMSATSGTTPSTVGFSVDITDLAVGTYNTQVEIKQVSLTTSMGLVDDIDTIYVKLLVDQPTAVEDDHGAIPKSYSLNQNFPNPFNPETVIEYNLAASGNVTLTVFNVLGQKVVDIVNGYESAGNKQAIWNGRDENGREVQSGVYFYRLTTDNFSMTRKMMLLK